MLGYIYVFTNKMFPENIYNIQFSQSNINDFSKQMNHNYIETIDIVFTQPTVDLEQIQQLVKNQLNIFQNKPHFYNTSLSNIKKCILNISKQMCKQYKYTEDLYISPNYEMIMH